LPSPARGQTPSPDEQRVLEHSALLEVLDERGHGCPSSRPDCHVLLQVFVAVPVIRGLPKRAALKICTKRTPRSRSRLAIRQSARNPCSPPRPGHKPFLSLPIHCRDLLPRECLPACARPIRTNAVAPRMHYPPACASANSRFMAASRSMSADRVRRKYSAAYSSPQSAHASLSEKGHLDGWRAEIGGSS